MAFFSIGKLIISSLFQKEATVSYPISPMKKDPLVRGHVDIDIEACIFCGICSKKCPTDAIEVDKAEKTWEISRFQCILCNNCVESCPKKCLYMNEELTPASAQLIKDCRKDARVPADS